MSEFNDKLAEMYKSLATSQKNTKGEKHRGDDMLNFRGKAGVNDTGIPLSPKAAKKKQTNRAGYHYPYHLQRINEKREADAMSRHGITDKKNPFNEKKLQPSKQPAVRENNRSYSWRLPDTPKAEKSYVYYWGDAEPKPESVTYVAPPAPRNKEPVYKATGKFPKLDEAIAAAKKKY
tara:strand:- start:593 stop:1123 length:531 start_codon:yes stop_codon:yes gene_type:complete